MGKGKDKRNKEYQNKGHHQRKAHSFKKHEGTYDGKFELAESGLATSNDGGDGRGMLELQFKETWFHFLFSTLSD